MARERVDDNEPAPPQDYQLVVPDGWFQLTLDPDTRDRGITALADRQFHGIDNAPHIRERVMRDLQKTAKDAYHAGGIELYLSTLMVGPLPLSSSLLISLPAPGMMAKMASVHELANALNGGVANVEVVELTVAGKAVRERRTEAATPSTQIGNTLPTTTVKYYVPIPTTDEWLLMTFSTPLDPLADQMVGLFDAVANTLHWG
jgi:hypothetical protein